MTTRTAPEPSSTLTPSPSARLSSGPDTIPVTETRRPSLDSVASPVSIIERNRQFQAVAAFDGALGEPEWSAARTGSTTVPRTVTDVPAGHDPTTAASR